MVYRLLCSYWVTALSGWVITFLVSLVVKNCTDSSFYTAGTWVMKYLSYFVAMPISGVLADFFNKKHMMQFLALVSVLLVTCLMITVFVFNHTFTHVTLIFLFHFMLCVVDAIQHPIFQGMIPKIVPRDKVSDFHAYIGIMTNVTMVAGPIVSGFLVKYCSPEVVLCGIGVSYVIDFFLISSLAYTHQGIEQVSEGSMIIKGLKEVVVYVFGEPFFRYTLVLFGLGCFGMQCLKANFMCHLSNFYAISDSNLSYYWLPMGIGSIIGGMLATRIVRRLPAGKLLVYTKALESILIWVLLLSPRIELLLGVFFAIGLLAPICIVTYFTHRQKITPPHLLSRTVAITRMLAWSLIPLAGLGSGFVLERTGNFYYLIIASGTAMTLATLLSWRGLVRIKAVA